MWAQNYRTPGREQTQFESVGSVRLHKDGATVRKPPWLVILKLIATIGMFVIGMLIVVPSVPLPPLQAVSIGIGILMIYVGLSYFIRPEPNVDNLGKTWGGDDQFQFSDNINRELVKLHMLLGPGRFISETFVDAAILMGLIAERTQDDLDQESQQKDDSEQEARHAAIQAKVEQQRAQQEHQGSVQLETMKYLQSSGSEE